MLFLFKPKLLNRKHGRNLYFLDLFFLNDILDFVRLVKPTMYDAVSNIIVWVSVTTLLDVNEPTKAHKPFSIDYVVDNRLSTE